MKAVDPDLLVAMVAHDGAATTLALVRVHADNEGSCILERVAPNGKALDLVQYGTWRVKRSDDGPATLALDFDNAGNVEDLPALLDKLAAELVRTGASWGLEAYEALT